MPFKFFVFLFIFPILVFNQIDAIREVEAAIKKINERLGMADKVVKYKVEEKMDINDPKREKEVMERVQKLANEKKVDPNFVNVFFPDQMEANKIIQEELKAQGLDLDKMPKVTGDEFNGEPVRGKITKLNADLINLMGKIPRQSPNCLKLVFGEIKRQTEHWFNEANALEFTSMVPLARLHAAIRALSHLCLNAKVHANPNAEKGKEEQKVGHQSGANSEGKKH